MAPPTPVQRSLSRRLAGLAARLHSSREPGRGRCWTTRRAASARRSRQVRTVNRRTPCPARTKGRKCAQECGRPLRTCVSAGAFVQSGQIGEPCRSRQLQFWSPEGWEGSFELQSWQPVEVWSGTDSSPKTSLFLSLSLLPRPARNDAQRPANSLLLHAELHGHPFSGHSPPSLPPAGSSVTVHRSLFCDAG